MLIHGYGADEYDLAALGPVLDPAGRCFTVCPRGPIDIEPYGGAAWYDRDEQGVIEPASLQRSLLALDQLVETATRERNIDRAKTVIIGFSQGGAMALALSLRDTTTPRPVAVACLSGMLQTPDWLAYAWDREDWAGPTEGFPAVYVQHGIHDPMVTIDRGRRTRDVLASHGVVAQYHEYPMQHEIRPESILDLRAWLDAVLTAA